MGTVFEGVKNTEIRDEFKCCNVYAKEEMPGTALQDFTAVAVVPQIHTISMETSMTLTISAVSCRRSALNVPS